MSVLERAFSFAELKGKSLRKKTNFAARSLKS
jgi:hypothetical protein